ncbi:MAG: epoxide hydrolase N-terminal domain-containing protein [Acidimicrobiaceae bacterium]|nr:epoxide hydrolase N-terminal domain-containing protein [Acidimicrobiaceae bacterium]
MSDTTPRSFQIQVPDSALDDLRFRLERTRWPDEQAEVGWEQGIPLSTMRDLAAYWADGFA